MILVVGQKALVFLNYLPLGMTLIKKWREEWLLEIAKTRTVDSAFRQQISKDSIYTCEKHFKLEDIENM